MEQNRSQDSNTPEGGAASSSSGHSTNPSVPNLESVTDSINNDSNNGSEWETDEGEEQNGGHNDNGEEEDIEMSSPGPYFGHTAHGYYSFLGPISLDDFDEDDDFHEDDDMDFDGEDDMWSDELDLEGDDFWDENSDMDGDALHGMTVPIEDLTPTCRAVYRTGADDKNDIMSEFSGDEKYEPKEMLTGNDGEGEADMYDYTIYGGDIDLRDDGARLTMKMRQLLIKLDRGKREGERLRGIHQTAGTTTITSQEQESSLSLSINNSSLQKQPGQPFSLHRLILRGPDQPQELAYSPSVTNHPQCGNSLAVAPSNLGLRDDVYTIHHDSIIRCGVLRPMTHLLYDQRRTAAARNHEDPPLPELVNPSAKPLRTRKATKFLDRLLYDYNHVPDKEKLILTHGELPICMGIRYGYLVLGTDGGTLMTFCIQDNAEPLSIYEGPIGQGDDDEDDPGMVNSVDIVRWPRYHHRPSSEEEAQDGQGMMEDEEQEESHASNASGTSVEAEQDDNEDEHEDPVARLSEKGIYDHYLVMTGNDKGLYIVSLPDHVNPDSYNGMMRLEEDGEHAFKFIRDHTWIRQGFDGEWLNDARVSPDGKWIAVVGDAQKVWVITIDHVPETDEQRLQREKKERQQMLEDLETDDSEYESDKDDAHRYKRHKTEVVEIISEDADEANGADKASQGDNKGTSAKHPATPQANINNNAKRRLIRQFGKPEALPIPDHVLREPRARRPGTGHSAGASSSLNQNPNAQYASQYVAWNASSTKFAHTSDSHSRVLVWSMPSKQLICCIDSGGLSFGISFHPKLDNMFAFANRYGFVHVVDVTDCCIGDEGFIFPKEKQRFKTVLRTSTNAANDSKDEPTTITEEERIQVCGPPQYLEKHDILMTSFRGQQDRRLRILDDLNGLSWSTDGRHLYVATKRRVLRYTIADPEHRIPSLFDICANRAKEWLEQRMLTRHNSKGHQLQEIVDKVHQPIPTEWDLVPSWVKQRILGDHVQLRYHDG